MNKVHKAAVLISWGLLAAVFIHLGFKWSSMPETTGVHFDSSGEFDVFASKKYIAYPFVIGVVFLLLLHLAALAVRKARIGLKINSEGETVLRERLMLLIDANRLFISLWAAYWTELVIYQHRPIELPVMIGLMILFVMFFDICRLAFSLRKKYPPDSENIE